MLLSANHLIGFNVEAIDGKIGDVYDVYFDAKQWIIRYIVVDTGKFLPGKRVLINPASFGSPQTIHKVMPVNLTGEKVKSSPEASSDLPVSKLEEIELHKYYNWVPYWDNDFISYSMPVINPTPVDDESSKKLQQKIKNNHLRSLDEVVGYYIKATDGEIGHIGDMIFDDTDWSIKYIVVDTGKFFSGKKVLLSLDWVGDFDWASGTVSVDLTAENIKNSPKYDPENPINREYELQLYDYYGRPKYWR